MSPVKFLKINLAICAIVLLSVLDGVVPAVAALPDMYCPVNMIHYWKLDEASGPSYADSFGNTSAACTGATCPTSVPGILGNAQTFVSTTLVDVPNDDTFNWGSTDSFTIEFWMQKNGTSTCSNTQVMVGRRSNLMHMWVGCDGSSPAFYLFDNLRNGGGVAGSKDILDGLWHHFVAIKDGAAGLIRLYVDGLSQGSTAVNYQADFASTTDLNIWWLDEPGPDEYHFVGILDELAMYKRALPTDEIMQHYTDGTIGLPLCTQNPQLTVTKIGTGTGTVTSSPSGVICGSTCLPSIKARRSA